VSDIEVVVETPSIQVGGAIICRPGGVRIRGRWACPECKNPEARRVDHVAWSPYYGTNVLCECGDSWGDGERGYRPFARYWRRDAQARFEKDWETALPEGYRETRDEDGYVTGAELVGGAA
jgi:hypothetical protein